MVATATHRRLGCRRTRTPPNQWRFDGTNKQFGASAPRQTDYDYLSSRVLDSMEGSLLRHGTKGHIHSTIVISWIL
ncbi:hypothetical protein LWI29_002007 [Acer saccharum]|uniref:Uncharacterized protein n=1 Tax=Acer saccharum TaxID=4024 RepID=A0AA39W0M9_ACESA|nr:hypothetical protein LWI29_002007 [Acer saccharum]